MFSATKNKKSHIGLNSLSAVPNADHILYYTFIAQQTSKLFLSKWLPLQTPNNGRVSRSFDAWGLDINLKIPLKLFTFTPQSTVDKSTPLISMWTQHTFRFTLPTSRFCFIGDQTSMRVVQSSNNHSSPSLVNSSMRSTPLRIETIKFRYIVDIHVYNVEELGSRASACLNLSIWVKKNLTAQFGYTLTCQPSGDALAFSRRKQAVHVKTIPV